MKLVGANPHAKVSGLEELPGKSNYFIGNDPKKWRTNVSNYAKVKYSDVYPGVDLVYYGNQGKLEYDFVVRPGADPRQIALQLVAPASSRSNAAKMAALRLDGNGDLVVGTDGGEIIFHKPVVLQPGTYYEPRANNQEPRTTNKELVEGKYALKGNLSLPKTQSATRADYSCERRRTERPAEWTPAPHLMGSRAWDTPVLTCAESSRGRD